MIKLYANTSRRGNHAKRSDRSRQTKNLMKNRRAISARNLFAKSIAEELRELATEYQTEDGQAKYLVRWQQALKDKWNELSAAEMEAWGQKAREKKQEDESQRACTPSAEDIDE